MTTTDFAGLLRAAGAQSLAKEIEGRGLKTRGHRAQCPFPGCQDKSDKKLTVALHIARGKPVAHCHRCGSDGDLLDLLCLRLSKGEAIEELQRGYGHLSEKSHIVAVQPIPEGEGKLSPAEVERLWAGMATEDELGQAYLDGRGLGRAAPGLVRFLTEKHPDRWLASLGKRRYRCAALLRDVVGNARGMQFRITHEPIGKVPKVQTLKGSSASKGFFGHPELIEGAAVVCVAEGLADTLALSCLVGDDAVVVGATGTGFLRRLGDELEAAGIALVGKTFSLWPQNDRPHNKSRQAFQALALSLAQQGAEVVWESVDVEYKDVAAWLQAKPDAVQWPTPAVRRAMHDVEVDAPLPPEDRLDSADGVAPLPDRVETDRGSKDLETLCALLDDPVYSKSIWGGQLCWDEMTQRPMVGGRAVTEGDMFTVRLRLEGVTKGVWGKRITFSKLDTLEAVRRLAKRRMVHQVREWLNGLKWDGRCRLAVDLPVALGHAPGSLEAELLQRWAIGAVARAMRPGCKMDTMLILVGRQGARKSTFFRDMAGEQWFTDSRIEVGSRDGLLVLRAAWICEWAELDSMRRARDAEALKAFLTSPTDTFRPPYGAETVTLPRHSVIVGTTNRDDFLTDHSGNRRYWPLRVDSVDIDWVKSHREQLWAEAVELYRGGANWWLDENREKDLADALSERHVEYEAVHPWLGLIQEWLEVGQGRVLDEVTTGTILDGPIAKRPADQTTGDTMQVGFCMKKLGWRRKQFVRNGRHMWVYLRPKSTP